MILSRDTHGAVLRRIISQLLALGLIAVLAGCKLNEETKVKAIIGAVLIDGNGGQVLTQLYGVLAVAAFCAVVTWIILKIVDVLIGLRVTRSWIST